MLNISPYIAASLNKPAPKHYSNVMDVINDNKLSYTEKVRVLDNMQRNLTQSDKQLRNGMLFNYSRSQASQLKEIEKAKENLQSIYAY